MKLSAKKLLQFSLMMGVSISSCIATSYNRENEQNSITSTANSNNQQQRIDSTILHLLQCMEESNKRIREEQKDWRDQMNSDAKKYKEAQAKVLAAEKKMIATERKVLAAEKKIIIYKCKHNNKKLVRRSKRKAKQRIKYSLRDKYVITNLDKQSEEESKVNTKKNDLVGKKATTSAVLGTFAAGAGIAAMTLATGGIATAAAIGLFSAGLTSGIDTAITAGDKNKVSVGNKTIKELEEEAKKLYASSCSEDESSEFTEYVEPNEEQEYINKDDEAENKNKNEVHTEVYPKDPNTF